MLHRQPRTQILVALGLFLVGVVLFLVRWPRHTQGLEGSPSPPRQTNMAGQAKPAGTTNLAPELSGLLRQTENRAVAHAAYLAQDRLVLKEAGAVLRMLEAQPGLMNGREQTRANFFARARVTDPEQKQLLEDYLLDSRLTGEELEAFVRQARGLP